MACLAYRPQFDVYGTPHTVSLSCAKMSCWLQDFLRSAVLIDIKDSEVQLECFVVSLMPPCSWALPLLKLSIKDHLGQSSICPSVKVSK